MAKKRNNLEKKIEQRNSDKETQFSMIISTFISQEIHKAFYVMTKWQREEF
jgi:flagellar biosynthesis protein FliP